MSVVNTNSVDADQTPRFAASDLRLHCASLILFMSSQSKIAVNKFNISAPHICVYPQPGLDMRTAYEYMYTRHVSC